MLRGFWHNLCDSHPVESDASSSSAGPGEPARGKLVAFVEQTHAVMGRQPSAGARHNRGRQPRASGARPPRAPRPLPRQWPGPPADSPSRSDTLARAKQRDRTAFARDHFHFEMASIRPASRAAPAVSG